jgi:uncharacterized membrane protein
MTNKEIILIILAIIVAGCIIAIGLYAGLTQETQVDNSTIANNTTNVTNVTNNTTNEDANTVTKKDTRNNQQSSSESSSSSNTYKEHGWTIGEKQGERTVVGTSYNEELGDYEAVRDDGSHSLGAP